MAKKDGEIVRNKTQDPIPVKDIINTWLLEKGVTKEHAQGRGDGDKKQKINNEPKFKNAEELVAYAEENHLTNEQQVALFRKSQKDNPDFGI